MPETVKTAACYSLPAVNKAGEASTLLGALKEAGVNLLAFWGYPLKGKKAMFDIVPEDAKAFLKALKKLGIDPGAKKSAFFVAGEDRMGALGETLGKLAAAGINVHAAQATSAASGSYGAVIQVAEDDAKKAKKALGA